MRTSASIPSRFILRPALATMAVGAVAGMIAPAAARADNIRCLALTATQAAGLPAGAQYATLGQPTIAAGGRVAFRGTLHVGSGGVTSANDTAMWLMRNSGAGPTSLLAREGDQAPDMPLGATYAELGQPILDPAADSAAFWSRLTHAGSVGPNTDQVIFRRLGSSTTLVFQIGSPFFGAPEGPMSNIEDFRDRPAMNWNSDLALRATLVTGSGGVPVDQSVGIWGPAPTGDTTQVARQGTTAHDIASLPVYESDFTSPVITFRGDMAYRANLRRGIGGVTAANDVGIWIRIGEQEVYYLLARTGDIVGHSGIVDAVYDTLGAPVLTGEPRVGFRATMRVGVGGVTASDDESIFTRCPCGSTFLLVRENDPAPGTFPGTVFGSFSNPVFTQDGRVLFGSTIRGKLVTASNDTAIWWGDAPSMILLAAREGSPAPRGNGATFAHFDFAAPDFWLASSLGNQLVFPATLSTGAKGIYVYTPGRGLSCLVQEGDSVEVAPGDMRQVVSLVPRAEGLAHDGRRTPVSTDRQFAFLATVSGSATGVFIADLPAMSTGCPSDWNNDSAVNSQDFFDFLNDFFLGAADINFSGFTDSQDFFDFLIALLSGC